jgi:hypothetical protein
MSVFTLPEPCSRIVIHAPHQIPVVNPYTPTLSWTLACPGWAPVAASTSANLKETTDA